MARRIFACQSWKQDSEENEQPDIMTAVLKINGRYFFKTIPPISLSINHLLNVILHPK